METFLYLNFGDGVATVAIKEFEKHTEIGVAFCSPRDQFVKSIGRELAIDRLINKKDFYVSFEREENTKLKWQVRDLVKYIVSGRWVNKIDIDNELEMKINDIVTETVNDFPSDIAPMTVHTNTIPTWAKRAVVEKTLY